MEVDFVGTVFTFVAVADLEAAASDLVAGITPAFNGFSATGFLAALLASETAGFFELGIRPRYGKNEQAEITGAPPFGQRHQSPCTGTDKTQRPRAGTDRQLGKRKKFLVRQDVGRTFGVQSLRLLTLSAGFFPLECVALGVGPEVLLSLLPNFASCEALHYSLFRKYQAVSAPRGFNRLRNSSRRASSAL
ncbi:hypothetical protein [Variovorax paradoxus]|uniref:hypothetical protein n=1 Tax=Variovorax paradoxus TaxID=34073 RepID=UPI00278BA056|nr:hypothetical protein [Variovorax paradoxus]MDQ0586769.1 hypothetical protein [Variovorax paradoxus]